MGKGPDDITQALDAAGDQPAEKVEAGLDEATLTEKFRLTDESSDLSRFELDPNARQEAISQEISRLRRQVDFWQTQISQLRTTLQKTADDAAFQGRGASRTGVERRLAEFEAVLPLGKKRLEELEKRAKQ